MANQFKSYEKFAATLDKLLAGHRKAPRARARDLQRLANLDSALREWRDARAAQGPQGDFSAEAEADKRAALAEKTLLAMVPE